MESYIVKRIFCIGGPILITTGAILIGCPIKIAIGAVMCIVGLCVIIYAIDEL